MNSSSWHWGPEALNDLRIIQDAALEFKASVTTMRLRFWDDVYRACVQLLLFTVPATTLLATLGVKLQGSVAAVWILSGTILICSGLIWRSFVNRNSIIERFEKDTADYLTGQNLTGQNENVVKAINQALGNK